VLADFGLSLRVEGASDRQDYATWMHAAPETWSGAASTRSDLYGLGSTLYTALAGTPAFPQRLGEDDLAYRARVLTDPVPTIAGVTPDLMALLTRLMAKDPAHRPADADDVAVAIARFCTPQTAGTSPRSRPSPAITTGTGIRAVQAETAGRDLVREPAMAGDATRLRPRERIDDAAPVPARPSRRGPAVALVASALALTAAAALGIMELSTGTPVAGPSATSPPSFAATPVRVAGSAAIVLAVPKDEGTVIELTWTGPPRLDYNVVISPVGGRATNVLVYRATTYRASVDPATAYCFLIQGTDGQRTMQSDAVGIRGAACVQR
jgi:hypothetical protein